jgi:hypothetical protein
VEENILLVVIFHYKKAYAVRKKKTKTKRLMPFKINVKGEPAKTNLDQT